MVKRKDGRGRVEAGQEGKRKGKQQRFWLYAFSWCVFWAWRRANLVLNLGVNGACSSPRLQPPHASKTSLASAHLMWLNFRYRVHRTPLRSRVAAKSRRSAVPLFWIERGQVPVDKTQGAAAPLVEGADFLKTRSPWRSLPHATRQVPTCVCRCYR